MHPRNKKIPTGTISLKNWFFLFLIWLFIFLLSNNKTKGATAKKPTKNLTELNVNGPILSMPVSWAIKVVPQIKVQAIKQISDIVFFIILKLHR